MDDLGKLLPQKIVCDSVRCGEEWVIPLRHVTDALALATEHLIAVLGIEIFRISPSGLGTEGYSGYDFKLEGDWGNFVFKSNHAATQYVSEHPFGDGYGYTLTTTSQEEFNQLRDQIT